MQVSSTFWNSGMIKAYPYLSKWLSIDKYYFIPVSTSVNLSESFIKFFPFYLCSAWVNIFNGIPLDMSLKYLNDLTFLVMLKTRA